MKKYLLFTLCFASLLFFASGCQSENFTKKAPTQELSSSRNDVSLKTEKAQYPMSIKNITVTMKNESNKEFTTGIHVFLEKKVKGIWYEVPLKDDTVTLPAAIHHPGTSSKFTLETKDLNYDLTPGEYRAIFGGLAAPFEVLE